jgi:hypothetical protein
LRVVPNNVLRLLDRVVPLSLIVAFCRLVAVVGGIVALLLSLSLSLSLLLLMMLMSLLAASLARL